MMFHCNNTTLEDLVIKSSRSVHKVITLFVLFTITSSDIKAIGDGVKWQSTSFYSEGSWWRNVYLGGDSFVLRRVTTADHNRRVEQSVYTQRLPLKSILLDSLLNIETDKEAELSSILSTLLIRETVCVLHEQILNPLPEIHETWCKGKETIFKSILVTRWSKNRDIKHFVWKIKILNIFWVRKGKVFPVNATKFEWRYSSIYAYILH